MGLFLRILIEHKILLDSVSGCQFSKFGSLEPESLEQFMEQHAL